MKIETFSTGGGVWLAEAETDDKHYAVVSNECIECLTVYRKADPDEPYMPDDMLYSKNVAELTDEEKKLYEQLKAELVKCLKM